jgi:peptidyl-prolyl cis-trans isomerase D
MLQRIRDGLQGQKWLAFIVLGLIGATFVFWGGAGSFDSSGPTKNEAATVDGEEIAGADALKLWNNEQARWARQLQMEIPEAQRKDIQDNILDQLIVEKLLDKRLSELNYAVSDSKLVAEMHAIDSFQNDGTYDPVLAHEILRQNGISPAEFERSMRSELIRNQLQRGLGNSNFLTPAESRRLANLENEEREVQFVQLSADQFVGSAPIEDAAIKTYYDANADRFMTAEAASLEFAELRLEQVATQISPTEADLQKMYDENRASYILEERRRMRHIVIPVSGDDDAAALKKAESVLAEARAGKDFAELAKKNSSDVSARDGGEVGFIEKKNFEGPIGDTLFSMKVGDVAGPVKSQFGYHILKLEEIQASEGKPFEAVRAEIDSQYRADRANALFGDRQEAIAERLEKGDSDLDKLATEFGLTRGAVPEFLRGGGGEPLGSNPELQQAVFDTATLEQGKVAGPVFLSEDRFVIVKVSSHRKPELKPLASVREEIVALLRQERGEAAAKAAADAAVAKLEAGEKLESVAGSLNAKVEPARFIGRKDPSIAAALGTAIFEAPRPDGAKPVARTAKLDNGATAVFVITRTRVADTSANAMLAAQLTQSLRQRVAMGDVIAYVNEAKRKAKIVKNPGVFEQ